MSILTQTPAQKAEFLAAGSASGLATALALGVERARIDAGVGGVAIVANDLALGVNSFIRRAPQAAAQATDALGQVIAARDNFGITAATAQSAVLAAASGQYQTVSSGLAATAPDGYFYVASGGDVFTTLYQKVNGAAVLVNILAGQSALDRVGRAIAALVDVDASASINAALNVPSVAAALMPSGLIRLDHTIVIPSAKHLRCAGEDATIFNRIDNIAAAAFEDKACVRFATGAVGASASGFTFIAPKTGSKVQAVWMITNRFCRAERIKAVNCGYAFFAQEGSQFCTFRDIQSFNANVHFETTAASDILFENTYARDGDGDNPLGFEGIWHTLFGSKRITFRNGDHVGKGTPFLVVADSGSGDAGLIDDIRFENCRSVCTTGVNAIQISKINAGASVGKVMFRNCELTAPGVAANIEQGQVIWEGGAIKTTSQEVVQVGPGTSLLSKNVEVSVNAPSGAFGNVYNATSAPITVVGGSVTTATAEISLGGGPYLTVSPETRYITPRAIPTPDRGRTTTYITPVDAEASNGNRITPVPGVNIAATLVQGGIYEITFAGRMAGTDKQVFVAAADTGGTVLSGFVRLQTSAIAMVEKPWGVFGPYSGAGARYDGDASNQVNYADFEARLVVRGNGGEISFTGFNTMTIFAGARLTVKRIA